jgi:hypothetical protein
VLRRHRALLLALLAMVLLTGVFFYRLAFTDLILARGDTFTYFYPYWDARNAALLQGKLPLWTSELFMGSPLLAEPQVGVYYPFNWLTAPFSAPDAIRYSILLHIVLAGTGVYMLFNHVVPRRGLSLPALTAGALFAFSGFVSAHVEQINQLQGIAWMPWLFWLFHRLQDSLVTPHPWRFRLRLVLLLAMGFALQFFSGHTQTVFITGVGLGIYALAGAVARGGPASHTANARSAAASVVALALVGALALLLVMPQFLPTLELTGMSNRGGSGFTPAQATAFSLPPHYLGQALLPSYDGVLFGEYNGTIGVIGLGLALLALLYPPVNSPAARWRWVWLALVVAGLLFAFGRYNPLYYDVLAHIRGFNLFRVPARWLALYTLGAALMAGGGLHFLLEHRQFRRRALVVLLVLLALMVMARFLQVAVPSLGILPEDITGEAVPTERTLIFWGLALVALAAAAFVRLPRSILAGMVLVELWGASQGMTYNDPVPRDVYLASRYTASYLAANPAPLDRIRVLSVSDLLFDVGDRDALRARYSASGLDENAVQIAFTALKRQEMLTSNLPLTWKIDSADGYGGGILPTSYYTQFTALLMPPGLLRTVDGRLGEALAQPECRGACIPSEHVLRMMGVNRLIMDKVYDVWLDDVSYDTTPWSTSRHAWASARPFAADEVRVLLNDNAAPRLLLAGHEQTSPAVQPAGDALWLARYRLGEVAERLWRFSLEPAAPVVAVSLVNTQGQAFLSLAPEGYKRLVSSDVKLYEAPAVRAFLATDIRLFDDTWQGSEDALVYLQDGGTATTLHGAPALPEIPAAPDASPARTAGAVRLTHYTPEVVNLTVETPRATYLVLADAWYPHWQALVNGQPSPVYRANVMFRAVAVPAGRSEVVFQFQPTLWQQALWLGAAAWAAGLGLLVWAARGARPAPQSR